MPHARLEDRRHYFSIFALYFSGYNAKGISGFSALPRQTINRLLKKIRRQLLQSHRAFEYLSEEGAKSKLPSSTSYEWLIEAAKQHVAMEPSNGAVQVFDCFKHCPRTHSPKAFEANFLGYVVNNENSPFTIVPMLQYSVSYDEFADIQTRRFSCKACPLGVGRRNIADVFLHHPDIYLDLMHYLATHRIKRGEEFLDHYLMAVYISWARRIAGMRQHACDRLGVERSSTNTLLARREMKIRWNLFQFMAEKPVKEDQEALDNVLYQGRSGTETWPT